MSRRINEAKEDNWWKMKGKRGMCNDKVLNGEIMDNKNGEEIEW